MKYMKIFYGIRGNGIDVTDICLSKLTNNNIITIPPGDINRAAIFSDPLPMTLKQIFIVNDDKLTAYDGLFTIKINLLNNTVSAINENDITNRLAIIHSTLHIKYGSFNEEFPEQKMAVRYLTGDERVLEIGGNIGRNSLIIASILKNSQNLVALESDVNIAAQLTENRDLNNLNFHIEGSALSKRKLIQQGWDTIPSDTLQAGYTWVNTISLVELKSKYNIEFDTLVLDCEGAFYYILMDMPEILDNVNLIIMENDYWDISKKIYIDQTLREKGFYVDYAESGGWGPCTNNFFEVWKRAVV
jgi:FkbM family methyltransferase